MGFCLKIKIIVSDWSKLQGVYTEISIGKETQRLEFFFSNTNQLHLTWLIIGHMDELCAIHEKKTWIKAYFINVYKKNWLS